MFKVFNVYGSGPHRNLVSEEKLNEIASAGWKLVTIVPPTQWQVQNTVVLSIWEGEDAVIPKIESKKQEEVLEAPLTEEEAKDEVIRKRGRPRKVVA